MLSAIDLQRFLSPGFFLTYSSESQLASERASPGKVSRCHLEERRENAREKNILQWASFILTRAFIRREQKDYPPNHAPSPACSQQGVGSETHYLAQFPGAPRIYLNSCHSLRPRGGPLHHESTAKRFLVALELKSSSFPVLRSTHEGPESVVGHCH